MQIYNYFFHLKLQDAGVKEGALAMDALSEADRNRAIMYRNQTLWLLMRGLCDVLVNRLDVPRDVLRDELVRRLEARLKSCPQCQRIIQMNSPRCVYCDAVSSALEVTVAPRPVLNASVYFYELWRCRRMFDLTDYLLSTRLSETEQHLAELANNLRADEHRTRLLGQATTELAAVSQALCDVVTQKLGVSVADLMQAIERHAYREPMTCPGCQHQIAAGVTACIYCGRKREAGLASEGSPDATPSPRALAAPPALVSRDATPADFPAILALNTSFHAVLDPLDREQLAALHGQAALHRVIERGGEVVAFLIALREGVNCDSPHYRWFAQHYARFLYVDRIVVAASAQSEGAGSRLYTAVYAMAKAERVPFIGADFDSDPPNPAMEKFYNRLGFREIAREGVGGGKKIRSRQLLDVLHEPTVLARWAAAAQAEAATAT